MGEDQIVEIAVSDGEVLTWDHGSLKDQFQVMTSLPHDTPEHRAAIINLLECVELPKDDLLNQEIEISEYIAHPVMYRSASDGQLRPGIRVVFPIEGIGILAGTGRPLLESIQRLSWASGRNPPWYPPLKAK